MRATSPADAPPPAGPHAPSGENPPDLRAAFDALAELVGILDSQGVLLTVNRAWRERAARIHPHPGHVDVGCVYWRAWGETRLELDPDAPDPVAGMQSVLEGRRGEFEMEFSASDGGEPRWFVLNARPIPGDGPSRILVTHVDISRRRSTEDALRRSEERFALAADGANDGIWEWNIATGEDYFSDRWCSLLGFSHPELRPRIATWHHRLHPEDRNRVLEAIRLHLRERTPFDIELRLRTKNGAYRWFRYRGQAVWDELGQPVRMAGSMSDITPLKEQDSALRELNEHLEDLVHERTEQLALSEDAYRNQARLLEAVFHSMGDGLVIADARGRFTHFNPAAEQLLGGGGDGDAQHASATLSGGIYALDGVTPVPRHELPLARALRGESIDQQELCLRDPLRPTPLILSATARPVLDPEGRIQAAVVVFRDISEHKRAVEALHRSLAEKETLLKETHHRVKNNLQVVVSILRLQAARVSDPVLRAVFREAEDRVRTMALIHERLYQSTNLARIDFGTHLADLTRMLFHSYRPSPGAVALRLETEPLPLEIDLAVPLGLIANELLSNALKYAFPGGRTGTLNVQLRRPDAHSILLAIRDDGVGLPPGFDWAHSNSLGLKIVKTLVDQLRGSLTLDATHGTSVTLTCPITDPSPAPPA